MARIQRALISVTDKTGIVDFVRSLSSLGVDVLSTGGTYRVLDEAGIAPLREVAEVTEFPEMLDGRVKTLHPRIAGGILAMRSKPEHMQAIASHGISPIDLVCVNLYEFESVAARLDATVDQMIENIDIGGPTMIRAAAKNYQDVAAVVSPSDYDAVLKELKDSKGTLSLDTHWRLMQKAFACTAAYDRAISSKLERISIEQGGVETRQEIPPPTLDIRAPRAASLQGRRPSLSQPA